MNPADKRISDLLDRWLVSIDLHLKYVELDEPTYRQIQPWPTHERPSRWILEAAQQKVVQLQTLCRQHAAAQDGSFAEGLELMLFLGNLVGAQNIQRFIPLADPSRETRPGTKVPTTQIQQPRGNPIPASAPSWSKAGVHAAKAGSAAISTPEAPVLTSAVDDQGATRELPRPGSVTGLDSTREMPRPKLAAKKEPAPKPSLPSGKKPSAKPAVDKAAAVPTAAGGMSEVVIADAVRLLKWGKEWHELPELITRMAERPNSAEVRRILKSQRRTIEHRLAT